MSDAKSSWTRGEQGDLGDRGGGFEALQVTQNQLKIDQAELKASATRYSGLNTCRPRND